MNPPSATRPVAWRPKIQPDRVDVTVKHLKAANSRELGGEVLFGVSWHCNL
jgi:hypothetical protein